MEEKLKEILKTLKLNESLFSLFLGLVTVGVVGVLIFNFWRQNKPWQGGEEVKEEKVSQEQKAEEKEQEWPKKYVVQKGDHLWAIAEKFYGSGYNWVDIAKENKLKNPGVLYVGQELQLPKAEKRVVTTAKEKVKADKEKAIEGGEYTVQKGDNLWMIAVRAYQDGYQWVRIAKENKLANPDVIEVGQKLVIPR